jgi:LPS export ABC transporter protein LptC/lipopolysaccharide transport protein LptA
MKKSGRGLPVKQLRLGLLMALFAFLAAVVVLYVLGRMGRPNETQVVDQLEGDTRGELVLSGRGFDYGVTQEGREVFHIRAGRILSDRDDNYELEEVELTMTREEGDTFELKSDRGFYNVEKQEASFIGNVRFSGPQGVELTTEGLELRDEGDLLVSSSPVEFRFLGRYSGRANRMRISPDRNLFVLAGRVEVDTLRGDAEPMSMRCKRFAFDRDTKILHAEGAVKLTRGQDTLRARRVAVHLTDDERQVKYISARWNVVGKVVQQSSDGQSNVSNFSGRELSIDFEEGTEDPKRAELLSSGVSMASLSITDQTGLTRRIDSPTLVGEFTRGALRTARAFDPVEIVEHVSFAPETVLRTVCGGSLVAQVSDSGELHDIVVEGVVHLHQGDVQGFGDRAEADLAVGAMEIEGRPAWFFRGSDELRAPRIVYDQNEDKITAEQDVQAVVSRNSGFETEKEGSSSDEEEPIRIAAQEAVWTRYPSVVTFTGGVKAWQGENFMQADEMVGEEETSRLTASGRVKTVVRPGKKDSPTPDSDSEKEDLPRAPLEVTADEMVYDRAEKTIVYSGNSKAIQAKRTIRCTEIHLILAEEGGFEEMSCEGSTRIEDAENGNTVTGERAVYFPDNRLIEVSGSPVVLRDAKGTTLQGRVLLYDVETGRARMQTEPRTSTPADQSK